MHIIHLLHQCTVMFWTEVTHLKLFIAAAAQ
jgi:hypothetical protein